MSDEIYLCMRDIGRLVGWTSHEIGKFLKRRGLRNYDGKPSQEAFLNNLVAQKWTADHTRYLWAWDRDAVLRLLDSAGVRPQVAPTSDPMK